MLPAHGDPRAGRGQLSRFLLFRKKKYRCAGSLLFEQQLIALPGGFFEARRGQDVSTDSILGVTL
jgi:hypothetical protein